MKTKVCTKCGEGKPTSEFYINQGYHRPYCKPCDHAINRESGRKQRNKRRAEGKPDRKRKPVDPDKRREALARYREKHKDKIRARNLIHSQLRWGKMVRPETCERCGAECKPHAHHDDYSKPLDVMWLCVYCHGDRHNELYEAELAAKEGADQAPQPERRMKAGQTKCCECGRCIHADDLTYSFRTPSGDLICLDCEKKLMEAADDR